MPLATISWGPQRVHRDSGKNGWGGGGYWAQSGWKEGGTKQDQKLQAIPGGLWTMTFGEGGLTTDLLGVVLQLARGGGRWWKNGGNKKGVAGGLIPVLLFRGPLRDPCGDATAIILGRNTKKEKKKKPHKNEKDKPPLTTTQKHYENQSLAQMRCWNGGWVEWVVSKS